MIKSQLHRICFTGGSKIQMHENIAFCKMLGFHLAKEQKFQIITGGFRHNKKNEKTTSVDWEIASGVIDFVKKSNKDIVEVLETIIPDERKDSPNINRFKEGKLVTLQNHGLSDRRYWMVTQVDSIMAVEGDTGTRSIIVDAVDLDKPIFPLPFTGGSAEESWFLYLEQIRDWFKLSKIEEEFLESVNLSKLNNSSLKKLVEAVVQIKKRHLTSTWVKINEHLLNEVPQSANKIFDEEKNKTLKEMIGTGKVELVLNILRESNPSREEHNMLESVTSRHSRLQKQTISGILSSEQEEVKRNRIIKASLDLIDLMT